MRNMKRLLLITVVCFGLLSCALLGVSPGTVRFTLGDETITLQLGFLDTDGEPMVEIIDSDVVVVFAADEVTDFSEPNAYVILQWTSSGTGTVTAGFNYQDGTAEQSYQGNLQLEVLSWKDAGKYCTGTFSGTVHNGLLEDVEISEGAFYVKRVPDDTFGF